MVLLELSVADTGSVCGQKCDLSLLGWFSIGKSFYRPESGNLVGMSLSGVTPWVR
jgi:hypothetical protein